MIFSRLQDLVGQFDGKRILVIGDLMLDEFVWGKVTRISPEAPVPVVEVSGESTYAGGAANVARNLREFIQDVAVIGVVGNDSHGSRLLQLLSAEKINTTGVIQAPDQQTIVKTRIVARQQQLVRVDREELRAPTPAQVEQVLARFKELLPEVDAVICEDYGKGFLSADLVMRVCAAARAAGKIVTADPNPRHPLAWRDVNAVKPNRAEAFQAAGIPWGDPVDPALSDGALLAVGRKLLETWGTEILLITLGEQGMMLFLRGDQSPYHIPTKARQVFDVSGAGDTAIALFTLALSCHATPVEAAEIANHASAVVVGKLGTATVTREELLASFEHDFAGA